MSHKHHLRGLIVLLLVTANFSVLTIIGLWVYESRKLHEIMAKKLTQNISAALNSDVSSKIEKIDFAVTMVVDELERQLSTRKEIDRKKTSEFLTRYPRFLSEVNAIRASDESGIVIIGQGVDGSSHKSWSDREFFQHFRDQNDTKLWVSKLIMGRVDPQYIISFSKRYSYPDGSFAGIVSAAVSASHFASLLRKYNVGSNGILIVRDSGNGLIAGISAISEQKTGQIGNSDVSKSFRDLVASGVQRSTYHIANSPDGLERILTFSRLDSAGMTAIVGIAREDYLTGWNRELRNLALLASSFLIVTGVIGIYLLRIVNRQSDTVAQLNAISELSPVGFVSFNEKYRVKYCSPAFKRMTGLEKESVIGLDQEAFAEKLREQCVPNARFEGFQTLIPEEVTQTSGEPKGVVIELQSPSRSLLKVGLRVGNTDAVSQILYFCDETREMELEQMKSEFLSTATHELRTPLSSIYGFSEMLLNQQYDDETWRELISIIHRQSELMASILNELLDLARIEARRGMDFIFKDVKLVDVVAGAVAEFKYPEKRTPPEILAPNAEYIVYADVSKTQQALNNLISNAYKYSPCGGHVYIRFLKNTDSILSMIGVSVQDQGIGMTPEQVMHVFERFYRANTTGQIPGTGLGMSIVKKIVESQHGHVDIVSNIGIGTTVTLWLPESSGDSKNG